jgi:glycosyl transferase family 25
MKAILINRVGSMDRLQFMASQLDHLQFAYQVLEATEPGRLAGYEDHFERLSNVGLSSGEACCAISHYRCWLGFLASSDNERLILEDDVHFSDDFKAVIKGISLPEHQPCAVKLESFGATVTASASSVPLTNGRKVVELFSNHTGTAAYVLNRIGASLLVEAFARFKHPIDIELFDFGRRTEESLRVFQVLPACCIQDSELPDSVFASSIHGRQDSEHWSRLVKDSVLLRPLKYLYRMYFHYVKLPPHLARIRVTHRL